MGENMKIKMLEACGEFMKFSVDDRQFLVKDADYYNPDPEFSNYQDGETLYERDENGTYVPRVFGYVFFNIYNWFDISEWLSTGTFNEDAFVEELVRHDFANYIGIPSKLIRQIKLSNTIKYCKDHILELQNELKCYEKHLDEQLKKYRKLLMEDDK